MTESNPQLVIDSINGSIKVLSQIIKHVIGIVDLARNVKFQFNYLIGPKIILQIGIRKRVIVHVMLFIYINESF